ncbi:MULTISPECIES: class I SAM-dependent methyltransferase [Acinetobacter]|uniref:Class I SAM-dependent methyltransferase n=1 Tax=Acinetobacter pecorum TaxID=2762215 RepID=A0ABR8VXH7_9GAMM|nr:MULTISPECIES: class I SAM-dependent methyltransferase [Acinetobacter]MBD8009479.1 class I SAM-dependent methyltransferase [Acinetobacter pecorum]OAL87524.1 ubiquinone biosynthesis protein UbiE [Acinetobacter sp. SFD]
MLYKIYQQHIFPHLLNQVMQTPALMDLRRELLLGVSNEVLEIGFGTGLNLPFYQLVDKLYALEPNADIFKLAETRIQQAAFPVEHIQASAENLPFAANSLQHVVSTWTLCSIPDLEQSLKEIYRVLQPGGTLHVVEHVLNRQNLNIQCLQHLLTPIQKKVADGCHLNRDIENALLETGFEIESLNYIDAAGLPQIGQHMLLARLRKSKD